MKNRAVLFLCFLWLMALVYPVFAADDFGLCRISLHSLNKTSGAPGDTFEMYGAWGETQGTKTPCINKGGANKLEVLSWSNSVIKVRIPEHLSEGSYKVGVYCNYPPRGQGSNWKQFAVKGSGGIEGRRPEIQSSDTKSDTKEETSESASSTGYTRALHTFRLGEHRVEGTLLKFEFPDKKIDFLYAFNFTEWGALNEKTNQAVIQLYDSKKALLDVGKSICIKVKHGKNFGSIAFNKINRANVGKAAYFSLTASLCTEGQGELHLKDNPELKLIFENASTISKILLACLETGKTEQICICSNKTKLDAPIRNAVSFLQNHPELKGKEFSLFEETTHHEGGSGKVSISMPIDELLCLQNELRKCK